MVPATATNTESADHHLATKIEQTKCIWDNQTEIDTRVTLRCTMNSWLHEQKYFLYHHYVCSDISSQTLIQDRVLQISSGSLLTNSGVTLCQYCQLNYRTFSTKRTKNGTHKIFTLQNRNVCKQVTENL